MGKSPFTMPGSGFYGKGNQSVSPGKYTESPMQHEDKMGEGSNLGNKGVADAHNKKHTDNPSWGEGHDGPLSGETTPGKYLPVGGLAERPAQEGRIGVKPAGGDPGPTIPQSPAGAKIWPPQSASPPGVGRTKTPPSGGQPMPTDPSPGRAIGDKTGVPTPSPTNPKSPYPTKTEAEILKSLTPEPIKGAQTPTQLRSPNKGNKQTGETTNGASGRRNVGDTGPY